MTTKLTLIEEEPTPADAPFVIDTEERANWILSKVANIEAEKRRIQSQSVEMIRDLDKNLEFIKSRHYADLEAWAAHELQRRGAKSRTLKLLQGNCAFRTVAKSFRVADRDGAVEWAKQNAPNLVTERVVEEFDSNAFRTVAKSRLDETGELLPGIEITPEHQSFSVKFGGE